MECHTPCTLYTTRSEEQFMCRSWYIAAHVWKIYDFKIEVVSLIINFSTEILVANDLGKYVESISCAIYFDVLFIIRGNTEVQT
jgi:hypothetical protein